MRTTFLLGFLLASTAQAQTLSPAQLAQSLNNGGTTTTRPSTVYSSVMPTVSAPVRAMPTGLVQKQYTSSLTFQYSNYSQFGGRRDFEIIQKVGGQYASIWPEYIKEAATAELKQMGKVIRQDENFFLKGEQGVENLNKKIAEFRARPEWLDLRDTARWLSEVWQRTPTYKEAGGIESSIQVTASSPQINPNGTASYSRVITSFPFTVR